MPLHIGGLLTLNEEIIPYLDFTSFQYCYAQVAWQCSGAAYLCVIAILCSCLSGLSTYTNNCYLGDGYEDSYMSFVSTPSLIGQALNGMRYQNTRASLTDHVNVTLYDGMV